MIKLNNVQKIYHSKMGDELALDIPELILPDKGFFFVSGESGSGKSTLINLLAGLDHPTQGSISVFGHEITTFSESALTAYRSSVVSCIFQDYYLLDELSVYANITLLSSDKNNKEYVDDIIRKTGLENHRYKKISQLSGGQKQRVAIARAIAKKPKILLCDEPTGNLDKRNSHIVLDILKELSKDILVIIVSHKEHEWEEYADQTIFLKEGKIVNKLDVTLKDETKEKIKHNHIPPRNILSLFKSFLLHKKTTSLFVTLVIGLLCSLFIIIQSFLSFNATNVIIDELNKSDVSALTMIHSATSPSIAVSYLDVMPIKDEELAELTEKNDGKKLYPVYSQGISSSPAGSTIEAGMIDATSVRNAAKTFGLMTYSTRGTCVCDEDLLHLYFGENIEVLAGSLDSIKDTGAIAITDYTADSMIKSYPQYYSTYDDIITNFTASVGGKKVRVWKVGAIIKTDYLTKYQEVEPYFSKCDASKRKISSSAIVNRLREDIQTRLGYAYSLNPNFLTYVTDDSYTQYYNMRGLTFSYTNEETTVEYAQQSADRVSKTKNNDYNLNRGEIIVIPAVYKALTGTDVANNTMFTDEAMMINIKLGKRFVDEDGEHYLWQKDFKVVGVSSYSGVNDEERKEMYANSVYCYGFLNTNMESISSIINESAKYGIKPISNKVNAVNSVTRVIDSFRDIFVILESLSVALLVIIVIFFSISSIFFNKYEIGTMKAMGCSNKELSLVFVMKDFVIFLLGIVIAVVTSILLLPFANGLLVKALQFMSQAYVFDFVAIGIYPSLIAIDVLIILGSSLVISLLALFALRFIRPINIIKSSD